MQLRRLLLVALAALAAAPTASAGVIGGQYLVVLKPGTDAHSVAGDHARRAGAEIFYTYRHALNGSAARLSPTGSPESRPTRVFSSSRRIELSGSRRSRSRRESTGSREI